MRPIDRFMAASKRWESANDIMRLLAIAGEYSALSALHSHEQELWQIRVAAFEAYADSIRD